MKEKDPKALRLELARGHWELGEHEEALACLERVDDHERVRELVDRLLAQETAPQAVQKLQDLIAQLEADAVLPATPTMAALLQEQGLSEQALEVAQVALRRNPEDARARAVLDRLRPPPEPDHETRVTLERWLDYFEGRRQGEVRV